MDDGFLPDSRLRGMEVEANRIFDIYRKQYFEGGYSSVYFFETEEKSPTGFGACFLIHKDIVQEKGLDKGWWDSIHVFEATQEKKGQFLYKLTTTVIVSLTLSNVGAPTPSSSSSSSPSPPPPPPRPPPPQPPRTPATLARTWTCPAP